MPYNKIAIGNEIRRRRLLMGLTQEQACEKASLSLRFYARIELGEVGMSVESLLSICEVLKTTPDGLLVQQFSDEAEANREWIAEAIASCQLDKQSIAIDILKSFMKALEGQSHILCKLQQSSAKSQTVKRAGSGVIRCPLNCIIARRTGGVKGGAKRRSSKRPRGAKTLDATQLAC